MIRIITDSAADFTQEELRRLDIRCVPMTISFPMKPIGTASI